MSRALHRWKWVAGRRAGRQAQTGVVDLWLRCLHLERQGSEVEGSNVGGGQRT